MSAVKVDERSFQQQVLQSAQPVLVDFWAPWCGPCRAMSGVVDQVANAVAGQATVVKVNIDEAPETAQRYGVQSIPAFAVFKDGKVQETAVGVMPANRLLGLLQPHLD